MFCDMFDKFFDCLNVRNYDSGKLQRKCFRDPYRSATDFRLEVYLKFYFKNCLYLTVVRRSIPKIS